MVFERFRKNSRGRDKAPPPPTAGTPSGEVPTGPSVVSCGDSSLSNKTSVKNTPVYSPASPPQSPKAAAAVEPAYTRYGTYYPTPEELQHESKQATKVSKLIEEDPEEYYFSRQMWQDHDVRFDVDSKMLKFTLGEFTVDRIENVEDTKGNNGDRGVMRITNLRLIWHAKNMPRINLSIGLYCIVGIRVNKTNSRLKGETESTFITAKSAANRFEFVFTAVNAGGNASSRLFTTINSIHRAYDTTKLYRELKMRASLLNDNEQLKVLPGEQQVDVVQGVWNLSSEQGNLGVMITTNLRVIWYACMNHLYNVTIPYLQLASCRIRDSKFGLALVLETSQESGEYILGFRIDPEERLRNTAKSIQMLQKANALKPFFGICVKREKTETSEQEKREKESLSDEELKVADTVNRVDAFAAYFADGATSGEPRPPIYSEELGLAIEQPRPGFTIQSLWELQVD